MADTSQWSRETPTAEGWYWFLDARDPLEPRPLRLVFVGRGVGEPDELMCSYLGVWSVPQHLRGRWLPLVAPALPEE